MPLSNNGAVHHCSRQLVGLTQLYNRACPKAAWSFDIYDFSNFPTATSMAAFCFRTNKEVEK